jgi:hypothetical protein
MKIIGPIPLNFDNTITDHVVNGLQQHFRLHNYYRVVYLGMGLIKMSEQVIDHTILSKCINNWPKVITSNMTISTEITTVIYSPSIANSTQSFSPKPLGASRD